MCCTWLHIGLKLFSCPSPPSCYSHLFGSHVCAATIHIGFGHISTHTYIYTYDLVCVWAIIITVYVYCCNVSCNTCCFSLIPRVVCGHPVCMCNNEICIVVLFLSNRVSIRVIMDPKQSVGYVAVILSCDSGLTALSF